MLRDDGILFAEKVRRCGAEGKLVMWEGATHAEQMFSKQFLNIFYDIMPQSSIWADLYIKDLVTLANTV